MNGCAAAKHKARGSQHFRAKANNRVDDLQGMVSELQQARREGRLKDVALLEEQMHQMLREWKAELREASPASSLLVQHELTMVMVMLMLLLCHSVPFVFIGFVCEQDTVCLFVWQEGIQGLPTLVHFDSDDLSGASHPFLYFSSLV